MAKNPYSSQKGINPRLIAAFTFLIILSLLLFVGAPVAEPVAVPNFGKVAEGIYRGGRPRKAGIKELKAMGIKTIINLDGIAPMQETDDGRDERQWTTEAGIKYIYIPMSPITAPTTESIDAALKQMLDPANHPVFVHCYRGSDRTGMVIAAYRITIDGWTVEKAFEEMKQYGHAYKVLYDWKDRLKPFAERVKRPVAVAR